MVAHNQRTAYAAQETGLLAGWMGAAGGEYQGGPDLPSGGGDRFSDDTRSRSTSASSGVTQRSNVTPHGHDKYRMRTLLRGGGVPVPPYALRSFDDDPVVEARRMMFPCVVKPLMLSASRGVIRADDEP